MQREFEYEPEVGIFSAAAGDDVEAASDKIARLSVQTHNAARALKMVLAFQTAFAHGGGTGQIVVKQKYITYMAQNEPELRSLIPDGRARRIMLSIAQKTSIIGARADAIAAEKQVLDDALATACNQLDIARETQRSIFHKTQPVSIHDLPNEVLEHVLLYTDHASRGTCRLFRELNPLRKLIINHRNVDEICQYWERVPPSYGYIAVHVNGTSIESTQQLSILLGTLTANRPTYLSTQSIHDYDAGCNITPIRLNLLGTAIPTGLHLHKLASLQFATLAQLEAVVPIAPAMQFLYSLRMKPDQNNNIIIQSATNIIMNHWTFTLCIRGGVFFSQPPIIHDRSGHADALMPSHVYARQHADLLSRELVLYSVLPPGDHYVSLPIPDDAADNIAEYHAQYDAQNHLAGTKAAAAPQLYGRW